MGIVLGKLRHPDDTSLTPSAEQVQAQLRVILASHAFQGSRRSQQFLEHVCHKELAGQSDALKERNIAVEVFGRNPQSDMAEDTIVRVAAREVRKRLGLYYGSEEGVTAAVRIDVPSGGYHPEFRYVHAVLPAEPEPVAIPVREPVLRRWHYWAVAAVLLSVIAAVLFVRLPARSGSSAFDRFWSPVFESHEPLLLVVGNPLVYHPSIRALKMNEEGQPPQAWPAQRVIQLPPNKLDDSDLIPVQNQYVGFGDMVVATQVARMLGDRVKDFRLRLASSIAFADLRRSPVVLIGAITNRWTMELGQSWRFRFDRIVGVNNVIVDTQPGSNRQWSVSPRADGQASDDYLLISRVINSSTGGVVIVGAGIKQFGTEAAGYLLSDPGQLANVLTKLPAGWESRNLQVVLSVRVIGNTPAQPEIAAWHVW